MFTFEVSNCLDELVDSSSSATFDLDGNDVVEKWTWVGRGRASWSGTRSDAARSPRAGRCSAASPGGLFFRDGYEVLDTLDDNRDGKLSAGELDGPAVWFDEMPTANRSRAKSSPSAACRSPHSPRTTMGSTAPRPWPPGGRYSKMDASCRRMT